MVKAVILMVFGLLAAVAGLMPAPAQAYTFTDVGVGSSFGIEGGGGTSDSAMFTTRFSFQLTEAATLTDFSLTDQKFMPAYPFEAMSLKLYSCGTTTSCGTTLYDSGNLTSLILAPDQILGPGLYQVFVAATLNSPVPGVFLLNTYEVAGNFVATTPIPAAVLMFGTALGGLGGLNWLRRRRSRAAA